MSLLNHAEWYLVAKAMSALTVPQMREVFARLLRPDPPSPRRIAKAIGRVLRRTGAARLDHRHKANG
jgi:hypothetical protein